MQKKKQKLRQTCFQHKYNKKNTSMHTKYIVKLAIYIKSKS
jgi:hypothetical protein